MDIRTGGACADVHFSDSSPPPSEANFLRLPRSWTGESPSRASGRPGWGPKFFASFRNQNHFDIFRQPACDGFATLLNLSTPTRRIEPHSFLKFSEFSPPPLAGGEPAPVYPAYSRGAAGGRGWGCIKNTFNNLASPCE